jgi:hypothetical protein
MGSAEALITDQLSPRAEQKYHDLIMMGSSSPLSHGELKSPEDFHILRTALRDEMTLR